MFQSRRLFSKPFLPQRVCSQPGANRRKKQQRPLWNRVFLLLGNHYLKGSLRILKQFLNMASSFLRKVLWSCRRQFLFPTLLTQPKHEQRVFFGQQTQGPSW